MLNKLYKYGFQKGAL